MKAKNNSETAFLNQLVDDGSLSRDYANAALLAAAREEIQATTVIRTRGWLDPLRLAQALASYVDAPRLSTSGIGFDPNLISAHETPQFLRQLTLPWAKSECEFFVATVDPFGVDLSQFIEMAGNRRFVVLIATQSELYDAIDGALGQAFLASATNRLSDRAPRHSARSGFWLWQTLAFWTLAAAATASMYAAPVATFLVISLFGGALFTAAMMLRLVLICAALWTRRNRFSDPGAQNRPSNQPHYSIIVALHREAELLPQTIAALSKINYPAHKLDILFALEERDLSTRRAASALQIDDRFKFVTVPHGYPQTKPKACNYALNFAKGDFVVLYDAEDRPDPEQLNQALMLFEADPEISCAQGRLAFYNLQENLLTRQFALEFSVWFELVMPGLERLGLPIPLGGTSNHFRTDDLKASLGWDAFNVTEDADLGLRLCRLGRRIRTINSTTYEEANCEPTNWIHQRSRWLKGYLQTYLVHMRNPAKLWQELGPGGFLTVQLLIGGVLPASIFHLLFWTYMIAFFFGWIEPMLDTDQLPQGLIWSTWAGLAGNAIAISFGIFAAIRLWQQGEVSSARQGFYLVLNALGTPLYWFLMSIAAVKAIFSFIGRPFYWAKTKHGISRFNKKL